MKNALKSLLVVAVVGTALLLTAPKQAEAHRWMAFGGYYAPAPVYAPVYPVPVYPRKIVYKGHYAPYGVPYYGGYGNCYGWGY